jgi:hypothetical protein
VIRSIIDRFIRSGLTALTWRLAAPETIYGVAGPYLTRWTLREGGPKGWRVRLHLFHRGDEDRELHTHPWAWAVALQLAGGYREERRHIVRVRGVPIEEVRVHVRRPGRLVFLRADTAHRVDLLDEARGSWSLILCGPVVSSWGFWCRHTGAFTPWRKFIRGKGLAPMASGGAS